MSGTAIQGRPLASLEEGDVEGEVTAQQEAVQGRLESVARSRGWQQVVGSTGVADCGELGCRFDRGTVRRGGYAIDASRRAEAHLGGGRGTGCGGCRLRREVGRG